MQTVKPEKKDYPLLCVKKDFSDRIKLGYENAARAAAYLKKEYSGRVNELNFIKYIDESKHSDNFTGVIFRIKDKHTEEEIADLKSFIRTNGGDTPVKILMDTDGELKSITLDNTITVNSEAKKLLNRFA